MAILILPSLKAESDVKPPDRAGEWSSYPTAAFESIAKSLDYPASENQKINSVPTMWALPLTLEMPLFNPAHALHTQAVAQWQGMLAAIALAKVRSFPLQVQELDIADFNRTNPFAGALWDLFPTIDNALYDLNDLSNPWRKVFIWTWNRKPVGMTSPSTLVVPAAHGIWDKLPWWKEDLGILTPAHSHLNDDEKSLLAGWLDLLMRSVNENKPANSTRRSFDIITGLLRDFRNSLPSPPEHGEIIDDDSHQYFGARLNIGSLAGLNYPIKAKQVDAQSSHLKLVTKDREAAKPLLLIDPDIAKIWDLQPQDICIHRDRTLANFNIQDLKSGKIGNWDDVICLEPGDLFLSELTFIDAKIDAENAFPGGYLPQTNQSIKFKGNKITPLIPINPILLDYFTPAELVSKLKFHQDGNNPSVRVSLTLHLSGTKGRPEPHQIVKEYRLEEQNAIDTLPILEIWPNFNIPEWKEYYAFYRGELDENSFQISFNRAKEPHEFEFQSVQYLTSKLDRFPTHINCHQKDRSIGLILLNPPKETKLTEDWTVGVDFGTSFTNIYINEKGAGVRPLVLKSLHLKVTDSVEIDREIAMGEYFIREDFLPKDKPLPIATILTTRNGRNIEDKKAIYDGRIYVPDINNFDPSKAYIESDLKWKDVNLTKLFLSNLCLLISALAAKEGVKKIKWSVSYPSAFSKKDIKKYAKNWEEVIEQLPNSTGMSHECPTQDEFKTESLAMAQYFADKEDCNLVRSSCIDLGGGSADVSIWEDNKLLHQCSFQLAGKDLFSQFVEMKPDLIPRLFGINSKDWSNIPADKFKTNVDVLLRNKGKNWLEKKRQNFEEDKDFQGLIRLMAIGTCGLYYYVGTILKALKAEGKYTESKTTSVYMGGNGSQLLHWLDTRGEFNRSSEMNDLYNRMLAVGSELEEVSQPTQLSQKPKDEAACGLVLSDTKLNGLDRKTKDPLIVGENCLLNGRELLATDRLEVDDEDEIKLLIPKLDRLTHFIDTFNLSIKDLDMEEIKPLDTYKKSTGLDPKYQKELMDKTETELKSMLLKLQGKSEDIRFDPPFILALKALLRVLAKEWAGK
jgi:hypothetical protein